MKFRLLVLFFVGAYAQLFAQPHWRVVSESAVVLPPTAEVNFALRDYRVLDVAAPALRQALAAAPHERVRAQRPPVYIELPDPTGRPVRLQVWESPVMAPELQAQFPAVRSYTLAGEQLSGRLASSPQGVHGVLHSPQGDYFIEPYAQGADRFHLLYTPANVIMDDASASCGVTPDLFESPLTGMEPPERRATTPAGRGRSGAAPLDLRVYRMALACTGEFAQQKGGTVDNVVAAFNASMTLVNDIFEREVAVRLQLIPNNNNLIFLNGNTDPYLNPTDGAGLLDQNIAAFASVGINIEMYDVGHVFTIGCSDGIGGIAGGGVCTTAKMRGVTCHSSNNVEAIARRIMAHEIGHQFSVSHSWSNCPSSLDQLAANWAYEPGSGSTIMSYAGSCGSNNVQSDSDDYFSVGSLEQFITYSRELNGSTCGEVVPTDNTEPMIDWPYTDGFVIPIGTPFELSATATDLEDQNRLTYCWEQYDLGPTTQLGMPSGSAPIFRSLPPVPENYRTFPRMANIVSGTNSNTEVLPTYSRDLTFRMTVRDNHPGAGAAVWEEVAFRSTATAGPFVVTSPDTDSPTWRVGEYREVTWEVANTRSAPVNCQAVDIRLSLDGGFTYPILLAEAAPNTGSAFVTVPDVTGNQMRVRVEAADNIFFDISNQNFRIAAPTAPTFTLDFTPRFEQICLPEAVAIDFTAGAVLGFADAIELSLASELPAGATAVFSTTTLTPGETTTLNLSFSDAVTLDDELEVRVQAVSGDITTVRTILLDVVNNDFSAVTLTAPEEGVADIGLETDFAWTASSNANTYDFQLATSPAFGPDDLVEAATELTEASYTPEVFLASNQLHFWRVRAVNECGPGPWLEANTFRTVNEVCTPYAATDTPINLPGTGGAFTRTSVLFVEDEGIIGDVNIPRLRVNYQVVSNVRLTLISPAGTRVVLYNESCFNTGILDLGFDDESPDAIACPPDDKVVAIPQEALSTFNGENTFGNWTLEVRVSEVGGSVGGIEDWSIEFCAGRVASNPFIVRNDTLDVPPEGANFILDSDLLVDDDQTGPEELIYTVVQPPAAGELTYQGVPVIAGTQFRQKDIDDGGNLKYRHDGSPAEFDRFSFVVEDNEGGYLSRTDFVIHIFEGAISSTDELTLVTESLRYYPNPTAGGLYLQLSEGTPVRLPVQVFDLRGRLLRQSQFATGQRLLELDMTGLPGGIYLVRVGTRTVKVSVVR
jgi:subtilisin-like proprotein convertase family protein